MLRHKMERLCGRQRRGSIPRLSIPWLTALVVVLVVLLEAGLAPAQQVDPDLQSAVLLKVLSYDRGLKDRIKGSLVIGIVYLRDDAASERAASSLATALRAMGDKVTVQGMKAKAALLPYDSATFAADVTGKGITVLYSAASGAVDGLVTEATKRKTPTLTGDRTHATRGIAVGVVRKGDKAKVVINLKAARLLGMNLDPKLLGLAEVLK